MKRHMKRTLSLLLALMLVAANCMAGGVTAKAAPKVTKIILNSSTEQMFVGGA